MTKTIIKKGLFLILVLTFSGFQIFSQTEESNLKKGSEIIEQARKIINEKNSLHNIATMKISLREAISSINIIQEFSLEFPDKLKYTYSSSENTKLFNTWNNGKYVQDYEMYINGKTYRKNEMMAKLSPEKRAQVEELSKKRKSSLLARPDNLPDDPKSNFLEEMWHYVFPLTLQSSFDPDAQFEYIGKAESNDQRADIVDVKSQYFRKVRLFFDEKTHLLLMMTIRFETSEGYSDEKYYYSNYKTIDGLLVPTAIKDQGEEISKEGKTLKKSDGFFIYVDELKINPTFSKDTFRVD